MEAAIPVALAWLLFASTHIGLASVTVRRPLEARLGRWGFTILFVAVASVAWALAIATYVAFQQQGAPGLALGRFPGARWPLVGAIVLGVVLMTSSFAAYARSPYARAGEGVREPTGLGRVTRHPFFVGVVFLGGAHALLATHLVGAIAMGGLALLAGFGAREQDRKLLALRGAPYADYLAVTSSVPFAAILAGRQRLVSRELPIALPLLGLLFAWGLRAVHGGLFAHGGAYVIGAVLGGVLVILIDEWRRGRRSAAVATEPVT